MSSIFDPGPDARHSGASSLCSSDEDECYDEEDYEDYAEALRGTTHGFPKLGMGRFSSVVCARRKDSWRSQGHDNELRALKVRRRQALSIHPWSIVEDKVMGVVFLGKKFTFSFPLLFSFQASISWSIFMCCQ